jgi:drug/metabolite transporter (DMT)-like permease
MAWFPFTTLGVVFPPFLLVFTWVLMGELIQNLLDAEWNKPWFLTYAIHSGYAFSLLPYLLLRAVRLRFRPSAIPHLSIKHAVITAALLFGPIAFVAMLWYLSLPLTSFAGNAAVYQSSSAFALILSYFFLREGVTVVKLACSLSAIIGVVVITTASPPASSSRDTPLGYVYVVLSTVFYALYEVLYARLTRGVPQAASEEDAREGLLPSDAVHNGAEQLDLDSRDKAETAALILFLMGVLNAATLWPVFFVADASHLEPFAWPSAQKSRLILLNMALDCVYNLALLWGISTSSPFVMSVCTTLVVPCGIVADWLLHSHLPSVQCCLGSVLVLSSVILLSTPPSVLEKLSRLRGQREHENTTT